MNIILGIDPGLSGALAFHDAENETLEVFDMPVHQIRGKRHIDLYQLARIVDARSRDVTRAVVEQVNAMPKQGVTSSFRFGETFGIAKMVVAASFIPLKLVRPNIWKKAFGLTRDKDASRQMASHLLPKHSHHWPLKKHDGRAEATLLAVWGAMQ